MSSRARGTPATGKIREKTASAGRRRVAKSVFDRGRAGARDRCSPGTTRHREADRFPRRRPRPTLRNGSLTRSRRGSTVENQAPPACQARRRSGRRSCCAERHGRAMPSGCRTLRACGRVASDRPVGRSGRRRCRPGADGEACAPPLGAVGARAPATAIDRRRPATGLAWTEWHRCRPRGRPSSRCLRCKGRPRRPRGSCRASSACIPR